VIRLFKGALNFRTGRVACLLLLLLPALACDTRQVQHIEDARIEIAGADEQGRLAGEAFSAGDEEKAREHLAAAHDGLVAGRDLYLRARADTSEDSALLQEFAALCSRSEDFDLAAKAYRRAAAYDPQNAGLWLLAGQNFVGVGEAMTKEALESLGQCLHLATAAGDTQMATRANFELGRLYHRLEMYELSREYYEAAAASDPEYAPAKIALTGLNFREGEVLAAANAVDQLGQLGGEDIRFLDAMLSFGYGQFQDAHSYFADTAENHMAYAKLLTRIGQFRVALLALERVVELDASNVVALNMLGSIALQAGDSSRALDAFRQSLDLQPDQPRTLQALEALSTTSP